jgi:hypothetical protein
LVRVQVSQLRKKLQEYFSEEGRDEPLVIEIPKGNYVPVFRPRADALLETAPAHAPYLPRKRRPRGRAERSPWASRPGWRRWDWRGGFWGPWGRLPAVPASMISGASFMELGVDARLASFEHWQQWENVPDRVGADFQSWLTL